MSPLLLLLAFLSRLLPSQLESLQIVNYYDLYNSLVVWSTKKWGCSGEHVTGLYHESEGGKL